MCWHLAVVCVHHLILGGPLFIITGAEVCDWSISFGEPRTFDCDARDVRLVFTLSVSAVQMLHPKNSSASLKCECLIEGALFPVGNRRIIMPLLTLQAREAEPKQLGRSWSVMGPGSRANGSSCQTWTLLESSPIFHALAMVYRSNTLVDLSVTERGMHGGGVHLLIRLCATGCSQGRGTHSMSHCVLQGVQKEGVLIDRVVSYMVF